VTHQFLILLGHYALGLVVLNVFINQLGLPVPAVPTLVMAGGVAAASSQFSLLALFFGAVMACLTADFGWYLLDRIYGIRVLKTLCRISLEPDSCVSQTQSRFERWGVNSLVIAKFVPGLAIIAPPMAGALRIGWGRFIVLSSLSAMLWVGSALIGGIIFRNQIEAVLANVDRYGSWVAAAALLMLAAYIAYKWWERVRFYRMLRMSRINVTDLHQLIKSGQAPVIVDVRSPTARALEPRWIPGAMHVPLEAVGHHIGGLPRDREIVLYCTCPSEASAARVARMLMNHGFRRVRPLYGGLDAWLEAGYSVEFAPPASAGETAAPAAAVSGKASTVQ
jgi:membrane protein DedA with SNARE-associated domain/rhodanese-related sulfurtransferase